MARKRTSGSKLISNPKFGLNDLWKRRSKGEPNSTKNIKVTMHRGILGKPGRIFLDLQDRLWYVPITVDRDGDPKPHVDYPLQLHFDEQGEVIKGVVLHPYYDPNIPVDDATAALGQALGLSPANAGLNEPYET